jgi:hypothetical protein
MNLNGFTYYCTVQLISKILEVNMKKLIVLFTISFLLLGCVPSAPPSDQGVIPPTEIAPTLEIGQGTATTAAEDMPVVVEYNLGDTTISQSMFPEDNRFHNMPVRLNGIIAAPSGEDGPYPVVLILHGNHPGCPVPEGDMVDRWPCDPGVERRNYVGFDYLVKNLAAEGYVALSININAEYTFGFGEPIPFERLKQLVDLHLEALATAGGAGMNNFGVELEGRVDLSRMAFIGHSQGAEGAFWLIQQADLEMPDAFSKVGYGPVYGLLMIASAANWAGAEGARLPLAAILPSCDRDVFNQDGQLYYEITRLDPEQSSWASSIWLERANHNYFNQTLSDEAVSRPDRPDCEPLLAPETQRDFLSDYSLAFFTKIFTEDPTAMERLGMDSQAYVTDELFGLPVRLAAVVARSERLPLLVPFTEAELETNLAGGSVTTEGLTTFYCEAGYYTPFVKPGSEPCKRVNLVIPGNPAMIVVSWDRQGGELRFSLPEESDLSEFTAISLRAAIDPLSTLNQAGESQTFTVQLVDQQGNSASVVTRADEPALRFPEGYEVENDTFDGGMFTGRVPLISIRIPLSGFAGVNFSEVSEIVILFDQTTSGSLFMSDIEFVR